MTPRCGKPMTRYEASNGPMPEEPACARREGHPGPCRSAQALAREYRAVVARLEATARPCGCGCGELVTWGRGYRRGHNPRSAWGNWTRDGWPIERLLAPVGPDRARVNRETLSESVKGRAA